MHIIMYLKCNTLHLLLSWLGQKDLNLRSPDSESGALGQLSHAPIWCHRAELNRRHPALQASALPTELQWHLAGPEGFEPPLTLRHGFGDRCIPVCHGPVKLGCDVILAFSGRCASVLLILDEQPVVLIYLWWAGKESNLHSPEATGLQPADFANLPSDPS